MFQQLFTEMLAFHYPQVNTYVLIVIDYFEKPNTTTFAIVLMRKKCTCASFRVLLL